jgi:threonine/homoserine/homoserine lactone efflux protein
MNLFFTMFFFSLGMSISPGPVNMIIVSSGANYGIKRTIPYVSGATLGFILLLLFIGLGFFQVIKSYPFFLKYLAIGGSLFIMYMGYKIASAKPNIDLRKEDATPKFYQGFLLQWLNPKAWIACVAGASIFSSAESYTPFLIFVSIYFVVCYASLLVWAIIGDRVSFLLSNEFRLRVFNLLMGSLLIFTAGYLCYANLV